MQIPDQVKKSVVFIGYRMADGSTRVAGTAFFIAEDEGTFAFLVTARHVVESVRRLGVTDFCARINTKAGEAAWATIPNDDWRFHPTDAAVDIAFIKTVIPAEMDHLAIRTSTAITAARLLEHEIGAGDEVFVVGLFRHHHGERRNIPIVRTGSIAALAEEPVQTARGLIDADLIEARSIGGLSGSPVFVNLGVVRAVRNEFKHCAAGPVFFLLGLIHGHYDVNASEVDACWPAIDANGVIPDKVNVGIAIVTPVASLLEAIGLQPSAGAS